MREGFCAISLAHDAPVRESNTFCNASHALISHGIYKPS
jgi:hypothetical protein